MSEIGLCQAVDRFGELSGADLKQQPDGRFKGACPLCEKHDPRGHHLYVERGDTVPYVYHCARGCAQEELTALFWSGHFGEANRPPEPVKASPRKAADPGKPKGKKVATYLYPKADGSPNLRVERWQFPDPTHPKSYGKECYLSHWDGKRWVNGKGTGERVLYRLPEILARPGERVLEVEGENKVDALMERGLLATCKLGGCGQKKLPVDRGALRGREVVVLPDFDEPGMQYAETILSELTAAGARARVGPALPTDGTRPPGYDVVDWFDEGHQAAELEELLAALPAVPPPTAAGPFGRGLIRASELPAAAQPPRLWFGIYRGTVTLLIGETGVGKTSFLYNLEIAAARNELLWRIAFGLHRPLNVLHIDPENAGNWEEGHGGICALRLERIGQGKPHGLIFHDGQGLNLADPAHMEALHQYVMDEKIDICTLDPIANLFATADENDNAEAARQMKALVTLSRQTMAAVIPCHHTGKDNTGNYGRGASARLAAADVGIVFRSRGSADDLDDDYGEELLQRDDLCRLQIVKNRWEGRASLFLRMAGDDQFERVTFEDWRATAQVKGPSKVQLCMEEVRLHLMSGEWCPRAEIVKKMKQEGFGRNIVDDALEALLQEPGIEKRGKVNNAAEYRMTTNGPAEGEAAGGSGEIRFPGFPISLGGPGNRETEFGNGNGDDGPAQARGY